MQQQNNEEEGNGIMHWQSSNFSQSRSTKKDVIRINPLQSLIHLPKYSKSDYMLSVILFKEKRPHNSDLKVEITLLIKKPKTKSQQYVV